MTTLRGIWITPGPAVDTPRVVAFIDALSQVAGAAGRNVLRALHESGQRRAASVLLEHARNCQHHDPERARLLRSAARFDSTDEGIRQ